LEEAQDFLNQRKNNFILKNRDTLTTESFERIISSKDLQGESSTKDAKS
jgi:amidophosphoribosyltransferase